MKVARLQIAAQKSVTYKDCSRLQKDAQHFRRLLKVAEGCWRLQKPPVSSKRPLEISGGFLPFQGRFPSLIQ